MHSIPRRDDMSISEMLVPEFDQEMRGTRKTLERVPMNKSDWKPHEKSMAMGYLARHVATIADWIAWTIEKDSWDVAPVDGEKYQIPDANTTEELLALFDKSIAGAHSAIAGASDELMSKDWSLLAGGNVIFTRSRYSMVRSMINHSIHHRAQLGVYLRLNDVPVPALYGPSADEDGSF
jgi:uncharacterized damage-inducible protein DinB